MTKSFLQYMKADAENNKLSWGKFVGLPFQQSLLPSVSIVYVQSASLDCAHIQQVNHHSAVSLTYTAQQVSLRPFLPRFGEATGPRASMAAPMMTLTAAHTHLWQHQQVYSKPCLDIACTPPCTQQEGKHL